MEMLPIKQGKSGKGFGHTAPAAASDAVFKATFVPMRLGNNPETHRVSFLAMSG
jgi:hypothetical protein